MYHRLQTLTKCLSALVFLCICGCSKSAGSGSDGPSTDTESEDTAPLCQDSVDNDGDGLTDCDDDECQIFDICDDIDTGTGTESDLPPGALVRGLEITSVDIFQSVRVPLMADWASVDTLVPIIAGKGALVRVAVTRQDGWQNRNVYGRVQLDSAEGGAEVFLEAAYIDMDSTSWDFDSTFNLYIPGESIRLDTEYTVMLMEFGDFEAAEGNNDFSRWPDSGDLDLNAADPGSPLRVTIVPVRYGADGSDRLPDTTDDQIQIYKDEFFTNYPITDTEFTVLEPFDWSQAVQASGAGWGGLLNAITDLRDSNGADMDEYYYGLFRPASTLSQYCGMGCVLGLSNMVMTPSDGWARSSIGLGFTGEDSAGTMIHEVGHAHGRWHAPCGGPDGIDADYPYGGGGIGVHGYDVLMEEIISPGNTYDFMSYCNPTWVSDYTYEHIFFRQTALETISKAGDGPDTAPWSSVHLQFDGKVSLGPSLDLAIRPSGDTIGVELIDEHGQTVGQVDGHFNPYSHLGGGLVLFPEPATHVKAVKVVGHPVVKLKSNR